MYAAISVLAFLAIFVHCCLCFFFVCLVVFSLKMVSDRIMMTHIDKIGDDQLKFYTGLPRIVNEQILERANEYLCKKGGQLTIFQEYVITLWKLRYNTPFTDLGYRFGVDRQIVNSIFHNWVDFLYCQFKWAVSWPTREELQIHVPPAFVEAFGHRVAVIFDCFEVFIERSMNPQELVQTWGTYEHCNTIKYLIGITSHGRISYISPAYIGRASDTYITEDCGVLANLLPGDLVLADRGFHISEAVRLHQAEMAQSIFLRGILQLHKYLNANLSMK